MSNLVQELICHLAERVHAISGSRNSAEAGSPLRIEHRDAEGKVTRTINLERPWRRARYHDLIREVAGNDWFELTTDERRERATRELKVEILPQLVDFEVTQHVFE